MKYLLILGYYFVISTKTFFKEFRSYQTSTREVNYNKLSLNVVEPTQNNRIIKDIQMILKR